MDVTHSSSDTLPKTKFCAPAKDAHTQQNTPAFDFQGFCNLCELLASRRRLLCPNQFSSHLLTPLPVKKHSGRVWWCINTIPNRHRQRCPMPFSLFGSGEGRENHESGWKGEVNKLLLQRLCKFFLGGGPSPPVGIPYWKKKSWW